MSKRYICKVYKGDTYKGILQNLVNDFSYDQDINTVGAQAVIEIGSTLEDTGLSVDIDPIIVSTGNYLVTETGGRIIAGKTYTFDDIAIDPANRIKVYEVVDNDNGTLIFDGQLTNWQTDYKRNTIKITVISWGSKLDDYLIQLLPGEAAVSYETTDTTASIYGRSNAGATADKLAYMQQFQVPLTTTISAVELYIKRSSGVTASLPVEVEIFDWSLFQDGAWKDYVVLTKYITNDDLQWIRWTFSTPFELQSGTDYGLMVNFYDPGPPYDIYYQADLAVDSAAGYASGAMYTQDDVNGTVVSTSDMAFRVISHDGAIGYTFNSFDPSDIVRDIIDIQHDSGGLITYDSTSIDNTRTVVSYNFKFNSVFEGVQKCVELAPANWYYYVDPATNKIHFHRQGTTADHTFTQGVEIENLQIEYTMEDIRNVVYFMGGDTGAGENLVTLNTNRASVSNYGAALELKTDNRVTNEDTADILSRGIITQNSKPAFRTTVTVLAGVYPIHTIALGDMVGFKNFNDLIDTLLLQVVGWTREPDKVTLRLNSLTPSQTHRVEDIKRNLDRLYTIASPDTIT